MTEQEISDGTAAIQAFLPNFDYTREYNKTQDRTTLISLYNNSSSNYEKLQLYRILHNENHSNPVIKKFINETYHVENDYLFQFNPREYDTVPQYIINECDRFIASV